ncbi:o-succinylbenzoate--CoA ligase [Cellulomonas sp.]|uniref:o-succinylbenzoate--CoA ligase n=1 Tax=Cellulomonas sp. TaxID=40001 RepID=UPI001B241271|nr:o-succinylbenzoate--CoA ligase [Cellulomonas sp.]MBO9555405.1 o-succinylbenzoate--CoA ligase [Cellulomonas sp.]
MNRPLLDVPARPDALLAALRGALDGTGAALRPVEGRGSSATGTTVPDGVAVVVRTSGSTGEPRDVMLSADALRASGVATERRLSGPGRWVLALPAHHVAGLQVLARSALAGTDPTVLADGPFRPPAFVAATEATPGDLPRYTSLVPTQLVRLLDDRAGTDALRRYDAVLVGGAASAPALLASARALDVRVVTTYGMTETCGGCVYDGRPLDGVRVALDEEGRVLLSGDVLADGYLGRPDLDAATFTGDPRVLRTNDLGRLDDGILTVLGRADDVILTGGTNVAPAPVEAVLAELPPVAEACVVGVPDAEWGQRVVAVLVLRPGAEPPALDDVRGLVADRVGPASAPRTVLVVPALPLRGPGKTDRAAVARIAAAADPGSTTNHRAPASPAPERSQA